MIAWQKPGRRPASQQTPVDKAWTHEELRLINDGYVELAIAVVRQWKRDGSPEGDRLGILPWLKIVQESYAQKSTGDKYNRLPLRGQGVYDD